MDLDGTLAPRGQNVMHAMVWWDVSKEWAEKEAKRLGAKLIWEDA